MNNNPANQAELQAQLRAMINTRIAYNLRNFAGYNPNLPQQPPPCAMPGSMPSVRS